MRGKRRGATETDNRNKGRERERDKEKIGGRERERGRLIKIERKKQRKRERSKKQGKEMKNTAPIFFLTSASTSTFSIGGRSGRGSSDNSFARRSRRSLGELERRR